MKKHFATLLCSLIVISSLMFFGCSKSDDDQTSTEQFIKITAGDTSVNLLYPADTVAGKLWSELDAAIYGQKRASNLTNDEFFTMRFSVDSTKSNGSISLPILIIFSRSKPTRLVYKTETLPINITITEHGQVGEYMAGSFTTTMKETVSNKVVPVSCNFRVKIIP